MNPKDPIRILVIDDQQSIHDDFRKIIETERDDQELSAAAAALFGEGENVETPHESFEIVSAHQGQDGVAMVARAVQENHPYPLAFVDVRMPPGWDGVETIQRIWTVDPELLIVLCTAYSDHTWEDIVRQLGRTDHLLILKKPFDNIEVRELVMSLTRRWHLAHKAELTRNKLEQMVTERTAELMNRSHSLEKAGEELRSLNVQLESARQTAEAASRAKSEFLANMSHEIRTPITAIVGFAELLRDDMRRCASPGQHIEFIDGILRNSEHLLSLISDILDMSKIESGRFNVVLETASPFEIIESAVAMLRPTASAKKLDISVEPRGPLPRTIQTDPMRLRQILISLIGNAIKFTEQGSVRVVPRLLPPGAGGPMIEFSVIDTGIGISADQLARLFQRFSQGDSSTVRRYGGSGLGLVISKRLAQMLGGDVVVESTLGQGACFRVAVATGPLDGVPMIDASPSRGGETQANWQSVRVRSGLRILLADDGVDNRRIISHILRKAGFDVTPAENGLVAYEKTLASVTEGKPFDLILMDMQMPVMEGYEATRRLREAGYRGPIIALTAHAAADDREKCIEAGCNHYLSKPVHREQLLASAMQWTEAAPPVMESPAATIQFVSVAEAE